VRQGHASLCVRYEVVGTVKRWHRDIGKETVAAKGWQLLLDAFQFVGIGSRNKISEDRRVFKLRSDR
jgi:hypothetical protein